MNKKKDIAFDWLRRYTGTDPNKYDTDGDGVNDSVDAFPLDPEHNSDQDGDGIPDDNWTVSDIKAYLRANNIPYTGSHNTKAKLLELIDA